MKYIIVGYGNIGHKRHLVLNNKCIATVDPDPKQKADYKLSKDIPISLFKKFDAVILAVPKQPKLQLVEYWLNRGKNVLVEKPFILSPAKAKQLLKIAKKNKVIWYTGYNHHFEPNIKRLTNIIKKRQIGKLYHAKMEYSFGNIKELLGTWRETGYGVLDETGCHLIDISRQLFGYKGNDFKAVSLNKIESKTFDHCIFSTKDNKILFETGWTTWKNVFSIDIYGSLGSLHLNGLCKWGGSQLTLRKRIFPAGIPKEKIFIEKIPDPTWTLDLKYFEQMIKLKKDSGKSDIENSLALVSIVTSNNPKDKAGAYNKLQGLSDHHDYKI